MNSVPDGGEEWEELLLLLGQLQHRLPQLVLVPALPGTVVIIVVGGGGGGLDILGLDLILGLDVVGGLLRRVRNTNRVS